MGFSVPQFPFRTYVWHTYDPAISLYSAPDDSVESNLAAGKRDAGDKPQIYVSNWSTNGVYILFPKLTDIRPALTPGPIIDVLECPKGSGRFYRVDYVDDFGKGFANEHRYCIAHMYVIDMVFADVTVPFPIPLP